MQVPSPQGESQKPRFLGHAASLHVHKAWKKMGEEEGKKQAIIMFPILVPRARQTFPQSCPSCPSPRQVRGHIRHKGRLGKGYQVLSITGLFCFVPLLSEERWMEEKGDVHAKAPGKLPLPLLSPRPPPPSPIIIAHRPLAEHQHNTVCSQRCVCGAKAWRRGGMSCVYG